MHKLYASRQIPKENLPFGESVLKGEKMDFKKILSDKRIAVETPENVIDKNGKAVFGTFKSEFRKMDFLDIKGQSCVPDRFNRFRYTMWEAV